MLAGWQSLPAVKQVVPISKFWVLFVVIRQTVQMKNVGHSVRLGQLWLNFQGSDVIAEDLFEAKKKCGEWWRASDPLGVNESVSSVSETARQAEAAGGVCVHLIVPSNGGWRGLGETDRFHLARSQPVSAQHNTHTFTYKRHPTQHGNLSGPLVPMNGWRRRRADCQTISVK